jgi:hypothetical protein
MATLNAMARKVSYHSATKLWRDGLAAFAGAFSTP